MMLVDENGCPIEMNSTGTSSAHCPEKPCKFCNTEMSSLGKDLRYDCETSWDWCQQMDTCAATIDWELIYQGD